MKKTKIKTTLNVRSDLERFNSEILANTELQERLKAATNPESLINLVLELGHERRYSFTKEEVIDALAIETSLGKDYQEYSVPLTRGTIVAGCACGESGDNGDNSDSATDPCDLPNGCQGGDPCDSPIPPDPEPEPPPPQPVPPPDDSSY